MREQQCRRPMMSLACLARPALRGSGRRFARLPRGVTRTSMPAIRPRTYKSGRSSPPTRYSRSRTDGRPTTSIFENAAAREPGAALWPPSRVCCAAVLWLWPSRFRPHGRTRWMYPRRRHKTPYRQRSGRTRASNWQPPTTSAVRNLKKGPKSDWGAAPGHGPRHRLDTLAPTFGPPELYATLAREWVLEASGEPMASAGHAHSTEPAKSELIVLINAATPLSSKSLEKSLLEERTTKFVSSHTASRSSTSTSDLRSLARAYADNVLYNESHKSRQTILLEKSRELAHWPERVYDVQRQATQHRYKQRIASDDSPSPDQRAGKSNPSASIGHRYPLVLPGGPNELFALLVSQRLTPKTPGPPPSNVVGEGGRADSYKTQQIALSNRAEAASEKPYGVPRIRNDSKVKRTVKNKPAPKLPLNVASRGTPFRQFSERSTLSEFPVDGCRAKPGAAGAAGSHWYYRINSVDGRRCWFLGKEGMTVRLLTPEELHRPARNPKGQRTPTETALATPAQATPVQVAPAAVTSTPMALGASTASWGDGNSRWTDFVVRWPS